MTQRRSIDLSVEVPGTPEEVWAAIATGPGIGSWFVPHQVEGRVGGQVTMDFGVHGQEPAEVTAWEPPGRVVFQSRGERPLAYEWLVEARDGGTCVVRLVNSGFGDGEDWDGDYDAMTQGWTIFLHNLRLHLTHFRGRRPQTTIPTVNVPGPNTAAWSTLCTAVGVSDVLQPGDRLVTSGNDVPALSGTVESTVTTPHAATAYVLLLDGPLAGTGFLAAEGDGDQVACSLYLYLYDDDDGGGGGGGGGEASTVGADTVGPDWDRWLNSRFQPIQA